MTKRTVYSLTKLRHKKPDVRSALIGPISVKVNLRDISIKQDGVETINFLVGVPDTAFVRRKRIPSDREFRSFLRIAFLELDDILDKLQAGKIDAREFGDELFDILRRGHSLSWMFGRQRAGDRDGLTDFDIEAGITLSDEDGDFLLGFIDDLNNQDPRYWNIADDGSMTLRRSPVQARSDLYVQKIRGSANHGFVETGPVDELYDWILGLTEDHCPDCPVIAGRSPYSKDANVGHPGDGNTQCLGYCLCVWRRRSDRRIGFRPVRTRKIAP